MSDSEKQAEIKKCYENAALIKATERLMVIEKKIKRALSLKTDESLSILQSISKDLFEFFHEPCLDQKIRDHILKVKSDLHYEIEACSLIGQIEKSPDNIDPQSQRQTDEQKEYKWPKFYEIIIGVKLPQKPWSIPDTKNKLNAFCQKIKRLKCKYFTIINGGIRTTDIQNTAKELKNYFPD